jgi:prepilin-type N-terminal cleavage/methylation domain-containing protein
MNANPKSFRQAAGPRDARGFTMMEILVALIVIGIGVFSLTAIIPAGTRSNARSGQQTRGSELAAITMERLLTTPFGDPDLDVGNHSDPANPYPGGYYVSWTVEADAPITNCKRLTVRARWPNANSSNHAELVGVNPRANDQ